MTLNAQLVEMALMPRPVRYYETVESTNQAAAEWLQAGAAHGAAVVADEQTAGRGRQGRTWHTPPGVAVAVSVVLRDVLPEHLAAVNAAATLAVTSTLQILQIADVSIKWANDVLVNGRKISGVLPEPIWNGDTLTGVVLGMGVNVRNDFSGTPLAEIATSIEACKQEPVDRAAVLAVLLFELDKYLAQLGKPQLWEAYRAQMTMLGEEVTLAAGDERLTGRAVDVTEEGALLVEVEGELVQAFAGDVTVVRWGETDDGH